jgi:hypothetical protein
MAPVRPGSAFGQEHRPAGAAADEPGPQPGGAGGPVHVLGLAALEHDLGPAGVLAVSLRRAARHPGRRLVAACTYQPPAPKVLAAAVEQVTRYFPFEPAGVGAVTGCPCSVVRFLFPLAKGVRPGWQCPTPRAPTGTACRHEVT